MVTRGETWRDHCSHNPECACELDCACANLRELKNTSGVSDAPKVQPSREEKHDADAEEVEEDPEA